MCWLYGSEKKEEWSGRKCILSAPSHHFPLGSGFKSNFLARGEREKSMPRSFRGYKFQVFSLLPIMHASAIIMIGGPLSFFLLLLSRDLLISLLSLQRIALLLISFGYPGADDREMLDIRLKRKKRNRPSEAWEKREKRRRGSSAAKTAKRAVVVFSFLSSGPDRHDQ